MLATGAALVCGAGVATQSRINAQLGRELDDGTAAAFLSFSTGLLVVAVLALCLPRPRRGLGRLLRSWRSGAIPWWYGLGGLSGAVFVLAQGVAAGILGVALFTVATVAGQTLSGVVVDRRGIGAMRPKPITPLRLIGGAVVLLAAVVALLPQVRLDVAWWVAALPLIAGLGQGFQQAVNGQLREASGSVLSATLVNFAVGTAALGVLFVISLVTNGPPGAPPGNPVLYVGGAIGVVFIAGYAGVVRYIGVLMLGLCAIAGQLVGSLLFDLLAPVADRPVQPTTVIGAAGALLAVALASVPVRRTTRGS